MDPRLSVLPWVTSVSEKENSCLVQLRILNPLIFTEFDCILMDLHMPVCGYHRLLLYNLGA